MSLLYAIQQSVPLIDTECQIQRVEEQAKYFMGPDLEPYLQR